MRKRSEYKGGDNRRKPSKERQVTVGESNTLLPFLFELLKEQSRSSVKGLLSRGQISVNGKVTRQFDAPLNPNDTVGINYGRGKVEFNNPLLRIVWEDDDLIVINKREGLLSVSTDRIKERTAYRILSDYLKECDPRNKIFVLHRLDLSLIHISDHTLPTPANEQSLFARGTRSGDGTQEPNPCADAIHRASDSRRL